jgi:hypothetical protein
MITERTERVNTERMQVKLLLAQEGLKQDQLTLQKARVTTQIVAQGIKDELIKLTTAKIGTATLKVGEQVARDNLGFAQASQILGRQEKATKLEIQAISIADLREELRHKRKMSGTNVHTPLMRG